MAPSKSLIAFLSAAALTLGAVSASAQTQTPAGAPSAPDTGGQRGPFGAGRGTGMMVGPGMWGRMAGRRGLPDMCDPSAAGFSEWRIDQIERAVRPTDAQKASFDELRIASTKAAELMAGVCPKEFPRTSADGLTFMEKRLESMLQAVKIFRPAFDVFYASLSDDQKSRLDGAGPGGSGWPWWQRYHG